MQQHEEKSLGEHDWISYAESFNACPAVKWLSKNHPKVSPVFRSTSVLRLLEAALNDMGVAILPCFMADAEEKLLLMCDPPKELAKEIPDYPWLSASLAETEPTSST